MRDSGALLYLLDLLAYLAAGLTAFQVYFIVNKLWPRRRDRTVSESISISAMFISILINFLFAFKNLITSGIPQFVANFFWLFCSGLTGMVGIGFWVASGEKKSFRSLVRQALKLESQEAASLARDFFRPVGAGKVLEILEQLAMVDNILTRKERGFIQSFSDSWGINLNWGSSIKSDGSRAGIGYRHLIEKMNQYLSERPPRNQVSQLADVIHLLVRIDGSVSSGEAMMCVELTGLINNYLDQDHGGGFVVAVVYQDEEQEVKLQKSFSELKKSSFLGGFAYVSDRFYSQTYAELVCEEYRKAEFFAVYWEVD
jgi:hypothetical protein